MLLTFLKSQLLWNELYMFYQNQWTDGELNRNLVHLFQPCHSEWHSVVTEQWNIQRNERTPIVVTAGPNQEKHITVGTILCLLQIHQVCIIISWVTLSFQSHPQFNFQSDFCDQITFYTTSMLGSYLNTQFVPFWWPPSARKDLGSQQKTKNLMFHQGLIK